MNDLFKGLGAIWNSLPETAKDEIKGKLPPNIKLVTGVLGDIIKSSSNTHLSPPPATTNPNEDDVIDVEWEEVD